MSTSRKQGKKRDRATLADEKSSAATDTNKLMAPDPNQLLFGSDELGAEYTTSSQLRVDTAEYQVDEVNLNSDALDTDGVWDMSEEKLLADIIDEFDECWFIPKYFSFEIEENGFTLSDSMKFNLFKPATSVLEWNNDQENNNSLQESGQGNSPLKKNK